MITLIVAISENNVIGKNGKIPWKLPGDLARFKHITQGHTVVMGPKTYASIGRPLPNRKNVILTHQKMKVPGCIVTDDVDYLIGYGKFKELFVIGGASVYQTFLSSADQLYITRVHVTLDGDTFFPAWNKNEWEWAYEPLNMIAETDPRDQYKWSIEDYRRI